MRTLNNIRFNNKKSLLAMEGFDCVHVKATGGELKYFKDTTTNKEYILHIFLRSGYFNLLETKTCDVMLVGGGGNGGPGYGDQDTGKGGGGAGGVQFRAGYSMSPGEYEIGIGRGGRPLMPDKGPDSDDEHFLSTSRGGDTTFYYVPNNDRTTLIRAIGGGGGGIGDNYDYCMPGGSGGGGGTRGSNSSGASSDLETFTGWTKYGNAGGNGASSGNYGGGGGGGAGGVGGNYGTGGNQNNNGNNGDGGYGGVGIDMSSYFGIEVGDRGWFAGGGAGGSYFNDHAWGSANHTLVAEGGKGGGGNGVWKRENSDDPNLVDVQSHRIDGMDGTGGGGGGSSEDAQSVTGNVSGKAEGPMRGAHCGLGGSGIAIIRYEIT